MIRPHWAIARVLALGADDDTETPEGTTMDEELLKQLHDAIDASNKAIEGIEASVNQLAELQARRARLIASRDALLPAPKVEQRAKAEPSGAVIFAVLASLEDLALTFAQLYDRVLPRVPGTAPSKSEVTSALRRLITAGKVTREGSGKATRYVAVTGEA